MKIVARRTHAPQSTSLPALAFLSYSKPSSATTLRRLSILMAVMAGYRSSRSRMEGPHAHSDLTRSPYRTTHGRAALLHTGAIFVPRLRTFGPSR